MSEDKNQEQQNQEEERKVKSPRDLTKRPPSKAAKEGPKHVRTHASGIRTTAETQDELNQEAYEENIAEDYKRTAWRTTGAGPNPYRQPGSREAAGADAIEEQLKAREENELHNSLLSEQALATYIASSRESEAADAEVAIPGETRTDTGQKIVLKPVRVAADERAVLPKAGTPHEEAVHESDEDLRADNNPGALYGGNVKEQYS